MLPRLRPDDPGTDRGDEQPLDPDPGLVRRVLDGDPEAYGELVVRHEERLRRVLYGILGESHLAEDAMQEAFLIAYRNLPSFRGEARFSSWLTRIAVREALRMKRRLAVAWRRWHSLEDSPMSDPPVADRGAMVSDENEEVGMLLRSLPPRERSAFVLYAEGHAHQEIADALGRPIGTISCWIHRAKDRLRTAWQQRSEQLAEPQRWRAAAASGDES